MLLFAPLVADAGPRTAPKPRVNVELPKAKAGDTIDLRKLDFGGQLARLKVARDPVMSAYALTALRRFADGTRSNDPVDKAVARALGRMKNGRAIAKRIVGRIDALPQATRDGAFGKSDAMKDATKDLAKATTVGMTNPLYKAIGNFATDTMPAQALAQQTVFELGISGLAVQETSDGDQNGDEVVVMSTLCTLNQAGTDFVLAHQSAPETGALEGLTAGEVAPLDRPVYSGKGAFGLLSTVAFEVDDDAADARAEYLAMVALARPLAVQLFQQGDTLDAKTSRFAFALDYTIGLLAMSQPERWPQGALVKTKLSGDSYYGVSVASLAATPVSNDGGVPWKLAHTHDLPSGKYVVYFDVPSTTPAEQKNIKVKITRIEALDFEAGGADLTLQVGIGNADLEKVLADNTNVSTKTWTVQRKMNPGSVTVTLDLWDTDQGPPYGTTSYYGGGELCGTWPDGKTYAPCPDFVRWYNIDKTPGDYYYGKPYAAQLAVNTSTGEITGDATGDVGQELTLTGTAFPKGKVKVTVTVE
ncbi:MAG TPA: hypothetical protein VG755_02570 [Nannocystaceae bacterium]|nr:hypothetical protein [Nannocystaceae bacterium]